MRTAPRALVDLARAIVDGMNYEFVGLEFMTRPNGGRVLRVYIDQGAGIRLDDCEAVSRQLGAVLDVENPIRGEYDLEVSSPGLDRPLFEPEHFRRFAGQRVRLRLSTPLGGRRKYTGVIAGVVDDRVELVSDGVALHFPFAQIDSARLVPEY